MSIGGLITGVDLESRLGRKVRRLVSEKEAIGKEGVRSAVIDIAKAGMKAAEWVLGARAKVAETALNILN